VSLVRRLRIALRDERGFSLPELVTVIAILPIVLGSTLSAFQLFETNTRRNQSLSEAQRDTRVAVARLARDLRNLASPTPEQPQAIDKAAAYDLVFQTVDAVGPNSGQNGTNVRRQRYCLDVGTTSAGAKLWTQTQTWTTALVPPLPNTAACPDPAWGNQSVLVDRLTNRTGDRGVFTYNGSTLTTITSVGVSLWSGAGLTKEPANGLLQTKVFLRNQNRAPVASFSAVNTGHLHLLLNGSASSDPEGQELVYTWYDGAAQIGTGILFDYVAVLVGTHQITLKVRDPAGLEGVSPTTAVGIQ